MKSAYIASLLVTAVSAFPASFDPSVVRRVNNNADQIAARLEPLESRSSVVQDPAKLERRQQLSQDPLGLSKSQTNCGPTPCLTFNEKDQEVSITGEHAYASPGPGDIRGPCPGLNAAANHGYLPRNGIASIEETVSGLGALYNMSPELGAFLAAYAIALDGNLVQMVWSIGGPLPSDPITGNLLGTGQGLSYSQ